jgi:hypothetical protein
VEIGKGDRVYLRVSPMKGMKRFGMKGKLAPSLAGVHDIFHVSQLKKF